MARPNRSPSTLNRAAPLRLAAAAALALAAAGGPSAQARDDVNPLTRHLESLVVGPGLEHRLVVVHPLYAPRDAGTTVPLRLATEAPPDTVGMAPRTPGTKSRLRYTSLVPERTLVLPGDVVRTQFADYVVTHPVVALEKREVDLPVVRASRDVRGDVAEQETLVLGPQLPPGLRWLDLADPKPGKLLAAAQIWADDVELDTERRSPAELGDAKPIAERVAEYAEKLGVLPRPPGAAGRDIVGFVALLDGEVMTLETFGTASAFGAAWPKLLRGVAVEAARDEVRLGLLGEDLPPPADPDRFTASVKADLLALYALRIDRDPAKDEGEEFRLPVPNAGAVAIVLPDERVAHFVLCTDPDHRGEGGTGEEFEPGVASRKARPSEAEARWLQRRGQRQPAVPVK